MTSHASTPRRCIVVRGSRDATRELAKARLVAIDVREIVWCAPDAPMGMQAVSPRALIALLGRSADAVVLDLHGPLVPDTIAIAEGLVRRGGALVLRMNETGAEIPPRTQLAIAGFDLRDVGTRFARRFERMLPPIDDAPLDRVERVLGSLAEQDALALELLGNEAPSITVLVADRGRGKSAAIGRAIAAACERDPSLRVVATAAHEDAVAEVLRFDRTHRAAFVSADAIEDADVIVIDEAAQLPIAQVKAIVTQHPRAKIVLATTTRGYEGTGRGFALRFVPWARTLDRPVYEHTLLAPIRWDAGDPLERWCFDALLLDAEPARLDRSARPITHARLDRDRLAHDERTLRQVFGLLVQAHYRTTPDDLARLLDAPNLDVHVLFEGDDVVAASLVAREGSLDAETVRSMMRGERRIAGHALPDTLVSHAAIAEAGALSMIRSVRIAVHVERRRRGLARALVDAVHASDSPDLFGTMFGATPELIAFRRALGYEVVRVGTSRGARSGEVSVVMVRAVSRRAHAIRERLRVDLARELPAQLDLMARDGCTIDEPLRWALLDGLGATPDDARSLWARVEHYASSAQPADVTAASLTRFVHEHVDALDRIDSRSRTLVRARFLDGCSWSGAAGRAGLPSSGAAMRAMRAAFRALLDAIDRR